MFGSHSTGLSHGGVTTPQSSPPAIGIAGHTDAVLFPEVLALVGAKTHGEGGPLIFGVPHFFLILPVHPSSGFLSR